MVWIFNVDYCFFVMNGILISNKMVWYYIVVFGDVVVVDCNCYKLILYLIIMIGVILVFLKFMCNYYGIIGLIFYFEFEIEMIKVKICVNLLLVGVDVEIVKLCIMMLM